MIVLPATGVAFAAFCVWLTVRIVNRRERWAKWTLVVVVVVPVLYVASFGPACWWLSRPQPFPLGLMTKGPRREYAPRAYWPIGWLTVHCPHSIGDSIFWYATRRYDHVFLPINNAGSDWYFRNRNLEITERRG
jgi:hypothetical protein